MLHAELGHRGGGDQASRFQSLWSMNSTVTDVLPNEGVGHVEFTEVPSSLCWPQVRRSAGRALLAVRERDSVVYRPVEVGGDHGSSGILHRCFRRSIRLCDAARRQHSSLPVTIR